MFVPLCDDDCVFVTPLPHLKNPQHVLLSSLLVSREKLTVSLWLGGALGLLRGEFRGSNEGQGLLVYPIKIETHQRGHNI